MIPNRHGGTATRSATVAAAWKIRTWRVQDMEPHQVSPKMRFTLTEWVAEAPLWPYVTIYSCGSCGQELAFSKNDFAERPARRRSNLEWPIRQEFDELASQQKLASLPFLDWSCIKCKMAARVYVKQVGGPNHGDLTTELVALFEYKSSEPKQP